MRFRVLGVLFLVTPRVLRAACGLCVCDVAPPQDPLGWRWETRVSQVEYDLSGFKGHYIQTAVAAEHRGASGWTWAGSMSLVSNAPDAGHSKTGFSNPVARGEKQWGAWALGSLLEFPLGDEAHGLASDHLAAIPYLAYRPALGFLRADFRMGYSHSFSGGDAHGGAGHHTVPLVVNPHENRELVYRADMKQPGGPVEWGAFLEGQQVLSGESRGQGFLTAGFSADRPFQSGWGAGLFLETPLVRPRRLENRVGLRLWKGIE